MTNRREFLRIGFTATAWPIASSAVASVGLAYDRGGPLPIYKAIYDTRFGASRRFAERIERLGVQLAAIEGDMTRVWFDDIYHVWQRAPIPIAGMTAHGPLFCFEQLARDIGMRIVFKAKHVPSDDGCLMHAITGPVTMLDECAGIDRPGAAWIGSIARAVAACPRGRAEISVLSATSPAAPDAFDADADVEALYSWVIAPAVQA